MPEPTRMKYRLAMLFLAGVFAFAGFTARSAQEDGGNPGLVILDFKPVMSDLMTMLIQPRHIKLYYAGEEENWMLARFELNELRAAFGRIGDTIPEYGIFPFKDSVDAVISDPLDTMQTAIESKDRAEFERAYVGVTAACNACHEAMHFPYIVMKLPEPDAMANFVDQEFRPQGGQ